MFEKRKDKLDGNTPEAARTKHCPHNQSALCQADDCMAWRWSQADKTQKFSQETIAYARENDVNLQKAVDHMIKNTNKIKDYEYTEGYCGLAGYPHNAVRP